MERCCFANICQLLYIVMNADEASCGDRYLCFYVTLDALLGVGDADLLAAVDRVTRLFAEDCGGSDEEDEKASSMKANFNNKQLVKLTSQAVTLFGSPAAEYFVNRSFKGLLQSCVDRDTEGKVEMDILRGQYGVAAAYVPYDASSVTSRSESGDIYVTQEHN